MIMDKSEALTIVEKAWDCWVAGDVDGLLDTSILMVS